ncbi:MAG: hypothetical protein ACK6CT_15470 [Planctomycetia bacterium]|jgi:hypothetical protein
MTPARDISARPSGDDTSAAVQGHQRPKDRVYPEIYYEILARDLGEERARWARLPYEARMRELAWYHAHFNTPDDLAAWPAELDGGVDRP